MSKHQGRTGRNRTRESFQTCRKCNNATRAKIQQRGEDANRPIQKKYLIGEEKTLIRELG